MVDIIQTEGESPDDVEELVHKLGSLEVAQTLLVMEVLIEMVFDDVNTHQVEDIDEKGSSQILRLAQEGKGDEGEFSDH